MYAHKNEKIELVQGVNSSFKKTEKKIGNLSTVVAVAEAQQEHDWVAVSMVDSGQEVVVVLQTNHHQTG
jgi:hypothetical protein